MTRIGDQSMQAVRRIGAAVLIIAALGVWFGMAPSHPDKSDDYRAAISAALASDTANNTRTEGAPQQAVVNGWTAKDLLTVVAQEGADPRPVDERPAALLTLVVIGFGRMLATSRPSVTAETSAPTEQQMRTGSSPFPARGEI